MLILYIVLALGAASAPLGAFQVQSLDAASVIPVYPGADKYVPQATEIGGRSVRETLLGAPDGWPLLAKAKTTYLAAATTGQVAAFYRNALRGTPSSFDAWKAVDPAMLSPGQSTAIHYQRYWAAGTSQYLYHWYRKDPNGDVVLSEVAFATSVDPRNAQKRSPVTEIVVTTKTYSKGAGGARPDPGDLGAPIYPGAVYDSNDSRTIDEGLSTHVFLTSDVVEKVVAFYEERLGRKAGKGEPPAGGVTWFFRHYSPASADDLIVIQEERGKGAAYRTRIDFTLDRIK